MGEDENGVVEMEAYVVVATSQHDLTAVLRFVATILLMSTVKSS